MSAQLFDEVIGELPPSTVDVAGIVRREKRRGAVRRVTGLATAVVALTVTAALGLSMTGGTGAASPPSEAGGAPAAHSTPPDTRFALVAQSAESAAASAKSLGAALDAVFRREAPGAQWIFEPSVPNETGRDGQPPTMSHRVVSGVQKPLKSQEMFTGSSGVLNAGRKGSLHLGISTAIVLADGTVQHAWASCSPKAQKCAEGRAPNGAKTIFLTVTSRDGVLQYTVAVGLPDGRLLKIDLSNDFGPYGTGAAQRGTPLTSDQVKAIAIDVASQIKA